VSYEVTPRGGTAYGSRIALIVLQMVHFDSRAHYREIGFKCGAFRVLRALFELRNHYCREDAEDQHNDQQLHQSETGSVSVLA